MLADATSELPKSDTVLMPVLFRDGADRRASARVPLSSPVRMGPPNGEPYAVVSARDVSVGGLFIDADRDVKVGARFSAEIVLPSGEKLYVPEAEVAYNRERAHGSGFGVRFIDAPPQVVQAIEAELRRTGDVVGAGLSAKPAPARSTRPMSIYDQLGVDAFGPTGPSEDATVAPFMPGEITEPRPSSSALERLEARSEPERHPSEFTDVLPRPRARSNGAFSPSSLPRPSDSAIRFDDPTESDLGSVGSVRPSAALTQVGEASEPSVGSMSSAPAFGSMPSEPALGSMPSQPALGSTPSASMLGSTPSASVFGSTPSEPALGSTPSMSMVGSMPSEPGAAPATEDEVPSSFGFWGDLKAAGQDLRAAVLDRSRNLPLIWTVLAVAGVVLVMSAVALALWSGSRAEAFGPNEVAKDRGVSAVTHQALVGERTLPEVVEPSAPNTAARAATALEPKNPLPPLVYVEDLERRVAPYAAPFGPVREVAALAPTAAKATETRATPPARTGDAKGKSSNALQAADAKAKEASAALAAAEKKAKDAEKKGKDAEAKKNAAKVTAQDGKAQAAAKETEAARKAADKEAKADLALKRLETARAPAAKVAEKPKALEKLVKTEKPAPGLPGAPSAPAAAPGKANLRIGLGPKASVLKTHVYASPHRFVIDLVGQDTAPGLPAAGGLIRAVRFGRHPDFGRVVIETTAPIAHGRASKNGRHLAVSLDFAR